MFTPTDTNNIPLPPNQMIVVICEDLSRLKIMARFAPNIKRKITAYKPIIRATPLTSEIIN